MYKVNNRNNVVNGNVSDIVLVSLLLFLNICDVLLECLFLILKR